MNYKAALTLLCVTLLGASAAFAQENRDERRRRGRPDREGAAQRASYAPLELHGMIGSGDNMEVSITNPQTNESQWVRVRDKTAKWYVESANPAARSVVVQMDGMSLKLEMIRNTGEPMSIAPQPTALSADQAAAEAGKGGITIGGLNAKDIAARMAAMRASGEQPSREDMEAFGKQVQALTPEQRTQFFSEMRTEMQKAGVDFGGPRNRSTNNTNQPSAPVTTTAGSGTPAVAISPPVMTRNNQDSGNSNGDAANTNSSGGNRGGRGSRGSGNGGGGGGRGSR